MDKTYTLIELLALVDYQPDSKALNPKHGHARQKDPEGPSERVIDFLIRYAASFASVQSDSVGRVSLYNN